MPRTGYRNTRRHFASLVVIASELGISPRRVQQLAAQGVLPRARRGRYWFEGCRTAYEVYLRRLQEAKGYVPWRGGDVLRDIDRYQEGGSIQ